MNKLEKIHWALLGLAWATTMLALLVSVAKGEELSCGDRNAILSKKIEGLYAENRELIESNTVMQAQQLQELQPLEPTKCDTCNPRAEEQLRLELQQFRDYAASLEGELRGVAGR